MNVSKLTRASTLAIAIGLAVPVFAADEMSYTYLEGSYLDTEFDDGLAVDGDGLGLKGSVEISSNVFLTASYADQDFDFGVDLTQWSVGIGAHTPLADNLDLVGQLAYIDAEVDTRFGSLDDSGYGLGVGLRSRLAEVFELEGGISYADLDDTGDDTSFNIGGRYYFTDGFAVGAGGSFGDDVTTWNANIRFEF